jgi:predicted permease
MASYAQLLALTLPVFALFALGIGVRRAGWLSQEAEGSVLKLIVNLLYPCLIFKSVLGNEALRVPANLAGAPLTGFATLVVGMLAGLWVGRLLRLEVGSGLRTFAFAVGIYNYGYIPIPLVESLWGRETLGVLLVYNVGVEMAIWTVGILLLAGLSAREGWKKLLNPVVLSLLVGMALNTLHLELPGMVLRVVDALAACAVPLGLLAAGAAVDNYLKKPGDLFEAKTSLAACALRMGLLPLAFLALAKFVPFPLEMKRILVIQAAMPAGMLPLVIARHYGGQPMVAARVIVGTTLLGLLVIPLWIAFGLSWVGV